VLNSNFSKLELEEVKEVDKSDGEKGCDLGVNSVLPSSLSLVQ
jgi:hypothetical protein